MNKSEPEVKPTCLWCNSEMYHYYEGSHDWVFSCSNCRFEKTFYVPHLNDENQKAIERWFNWVGFVQSFEPSTSSEAPTVNEEGDGKEASEGSESKDAIIKRLEDENDRLTSKCLTWLKGWNDQQDDIDMLRSALSHIVTYGGTTCDGVSCNGSWCAEQARQAFANQRIITIKGFSGFPSQIFLLFGSYEGGRRFRGIIFQDSKQT